jgi:hypothetical protein
MRVRDARIAIHDGLMALPWRPCYLTAMWILCGELQALYADWIGDDEHRLMASTMEMVRDVVISGESAQAAGQAAGLSDAWDGMFDTRLAEWSAGLLNTVAVFWSLVTEIAGISGRYSAAGEVSPAVRKRWPERTRHGLIIEDPDEETDDSSPLAQALMLFGRIVSQVADYEGTEWDPVGIRAQIL